MGGALFYVPLVIHSEKGLRTLKKRRIAVVRWQYSWLCHWSLCHYSNHSEVRLPVVLVTCFNYDIKKIDYDAESSLVFGTTKLNIWAGGLSQVWNKVSFFKSELGKRLSSASLSLQPRKTQLTVIDFFRHNQK